MTRSPRLLPALLLGLAGLAILAQPALAGDKTDGSVDFEARLEPADLTAGGEGHLVVRVIPLDKAEHELDTYHYLYAKGEKVVKYVPIEAAGVTYDLAQKTVTDPIEISEFDEKKLVWKDPFEIRVPITLAADVKDGTKVGLAFTYEGCLFEQGCYGKLEGAAFVVLGAGEGGSALDGSGGAAVDPAVAADPTASPAAGDDQTNGGDVSIDYEESEKEGEGTVSVTFTPAFLHHMYGPKGSAPIQVRPVEQDGVTWGTVAIDAPAEFEDPYTVSIPVTKTAAVRVLEVEVFFSSCDASGCKENIDETLWIRWPGAAPAPEKPAPAPKGELMFPMVKGDELGGDIEDDASIVQRLMRDQPVLGLLFILLGGIGLAFTPCVLPIIPITVSVITGGNADIPKKRLSMLLLMYVLGLSLAFATLGTIAAGVGGSVSALFDLPATQWGIAILFVLLAFSMIGVYELQPPAWLMKLQGGAQKRSGSIIGAFMFGVLGAIIASPCTAPAVAGMLLVTAKTGSLPLGFAMFFVLGLGMGAVFYAAGALNFLMRPGPWMVWVRYVFGVLLWATALYYTFGKGLIGPTTLWVLGAAVSALAAYGIYWHLTTKEGEDPGKARARGLQVAATWVVTTVLIFFFAAPFVGDWTYVKDRQHLAKLVKEANAEGKPVVVDFWAITCTTCVEYDKLISNHKELKPLFERVAKLKVDTGDASVDQKDLRDALGIETGGNPYMVLIDKQGRIRKAADVTGWYGSEDKSVEMLKARLAVILGKPKQEQQPAEAPDKVEAGDAGSAPAGK